MFDRWRGGQEGNEQGDQEYHRALTSLRQQVQSVITGVDEIINNLAPAYPKEALSHLSRRFEGISRDFTSYTIATGNMFYKVVARSNNRRTSAKEVAAQAKRVAKLFEKYTKNPKSYSLVDSRLEVYKLRDVLDNFLSYCI